MALLNSMQENNFAEHVSFCCAHIDDQSLAKVCDLLEQKNSSLGSFELYHRSLNSAAFDKIINSIKKSSITSLKCHGYYLNIANIWTICDLLENHDLVKLRLNFANYEGDILNAILPAIKKSTLIKLNIRGQERRSEDVRNEIKLMLQEREQNLNGRYRIKSARSLASVQE